MGFYTIQISKYRTAKALGITMIDTTVKSGMSIFAPRWDMVIGHKEGILSNEQYAEQYMSVIQDSIRTRSREWRIFLEKYKGVDLHSVVIAPIQVSVTGIC
jgi:hypothetical protein